MVSWPALMLTFDATCEERLIGNMQTTHAPRRGMILILLSSLFWGTVGIATQAIYLIADTNPLSIGFFRLLFAAPALLLCSWFLLRRRAFQIHWRDMLKMVMIGAMLALYQICYFASIVQVGVTIAVLVTLCTAPIMVALLGAVFLRERLTRVTLLALVCALLGTVLLVWVDPQGAAESKNTVLGVILALGSAFGYAALTLFSRSLSDRYHPIQPIAIGFSSGALILLPFALWNGLVISYPSEAWLMMVYMGLIPSALAYVMFYAGLRFVPATVATILTLIEPLTSTILAWILFQEQIGQYGLVGAALLFAAIALLYWGTTVTQARTEPLQA
jgi:DME family drug/metabolite transporter